MSREKLKEYILNKAEYPFVLRGMIDTWPAAKWTPYTLSDQLPEQEIRFRLGKKSEEDVQWETGCLYENATIPQFIEWSHGKCSHGNPLAPYSTVKYWCYADYKYMVKLFAEKCDILEAIQWETFGFPGRQGDDSTFWLGSQGSYTVCHYDTYGCNLVAQLYGRKQWLLFSPADTKALYPTRIPYEESSVFSEVNIDLPDLCRHPRYKEAVPYRVILEPGDVLFVPRQWWHFVKSLDTTISVNTWIELDCDNESRLHEAMTRLLACTVMSEMSESDSIQKIWLNPTEVATSFSQNMTYIKQVLTCINTDCTTSMTASYQDPEDRSSDVKRQKLDTVRDGLSAAKSCKLTDRIASPVDPTVLHHKYKQSLSNRITLDGRKTEYRSTLDKSVVSPLPGSHSVSDRSPSFIAGESSMCNDYTIVSDQFDKKHIIRIEPDVRQMTADNTWPDVHNQKMEEITDENIINSILHPDVINVICNNLLTSCKIKH